MTRRRLLVLNGQKILQRERDDGGGWINEAVDRAGAIQAGLYNLFSARLADHGQQYEGVIVHVDEDFVYQQTDKPPAADLEIIGKMPLEMTGKAIVMHPRPAFDVAPAPGSTKSINYDAAGMAVAIDVARQGRGKGRRI